MVVHLAVDQEVETRRGLTPKVKSTVRFGFASAAASGSMVRSRAAIDAIDGAAGPATTRPNDSSPRLLNVIRM